MSSGSLKTKTTPPTPWAGSGTSISPNLLRDRHCLFEYSDFDWLRLHCSRHEILDTLKFTRITISPKPLSLLPQLIPILAERKSLSHSINSFSFRHVLVHHTWVAFRRQFPLRNVQLRTTILTCHFERHFPFLRLATSLRHARQYLVFHFPLSLLDNGCFKVWKDSCTLCDKWTDVQYWRVWKYTPSRPRRRCALLSPT